MLAEKECFKMLEISCCAFSKVKIANNKLKKKSKWAHFVM